MSQIILSGSTPFSPVASIKPIRPRNGLMDAANGCVDWFVRNLYDRGPGVRYAVEQTGGYTIPRIVQQWNRTRSLTGEANPMAALEMGVREFVADFADTFLPGILATPIIGALLDRHHKTLVRKNMGSSALTFYESLLQKGANDNYCSQTEFFDRVGQTLRHHAQTLNPGKPLAELSLAAHLNAIAHESQLESVAQRLIGDLKLPHPDLSLSHGSHTLNISLPDLLQDLWNLKETPLFEKEEALFQSGQAARHPEWGRRMASTLSKTRQLMPHQMWGILAAVAVSVSIPFAVRLITRGYYGDDVFPGTKELATHFSKTPTPTPTSADKTHSPPKKFVPFPYLKESIEKGQWGPVAGTAAFFTVLGGMVFRRFRMQGLSPLKWPHWLKVYEFNRGAPIATLAQMELTYGLLCGTRLASSRDDSEFRETGLRDCLLGWPTLTYGFEALKRLMGVVANRRLAKTFQNNLLLMKNSSELRTGEEISEAFFKNLSIHGERSEALEKTRLAHRWITFVSALTNWGLLAFAEPQLGIWLTNQLEMKKIQEKNEAQSQQATWKASWNNLNDFHLPPLSIRPEWGALLPTGSLFWMPTSTGEIPSSAAMPTPATTAISSPLPVTLKPQQTTLRPPVAISPATLPKAGETKMQGT